MRPCRPQPRLSAMICRLRCNAASASESASESENSVVRLDDLQCYWAREEEPRIYSPWPYTTACADVPMVTELFALRRPIALLFAGISVYACRCRPTVPYLYLQHSVKLCSRCTN